MKDVVYKNIVVTTDGSDTSSAAFPHALFFAKNFNSKITFLWVVESVEQAMMGMVPEGFSPPVSTIGETAIESYRYNKKIAQEYLHKIKSEFENSGAKRIETIITEGEPQKEIVTSAKNVKADLILISTHGRSGLDKLLLGSVADYVVKHAPCPVLLVRPQKK